MHPRHHAPDDATVALSPLAEATPPKDSEGRPAAALDLEDGSEPVVSVGPPSHSRRMALLSMLLLVLQGTASTIVMRLSRTREGQHYLASVAVVFVETTKLTACCLLQLRQAAADARRAGAPPWPAVRADFISIARRSWPMALPAGLFVFQQLLVIVAATNLDVVAFQIFNQSFKLVPTAIFAYWLLGQRLEPVQWASIPVLAVGVILVTLNNGDSGGGGGGGGKSAHAAGGHVAWLIGMLACSATGLSSAYAGVYFEQYVKGSNAASLVVRNIQLGLYGVPLSTTYAVLRDGRRMRAGGPLQGFDHLTWVVVALSACGGLVVGGVVKYCDNVIKNFALAVSVILTVLAAIPVFGQWPTPAFLLGVAVVLLSVLMYSRVVRLPDASRLRHAAHALSAWAPRTARLQLSLAVLGTALLLLLAYAGWKAGIRQQYLAEQADLLLQAGLQVADAVTGSAGDSAPRGS